MKKVKFLFIAFMSVILFSCSSENNNEVIEPGGNSKKQEIIFNISTYFKSEISDYDGKNTKSSLVESGIKVIQTRIIKLNGDAQEAISITTKNYDVNSDNLFIKDNLSVGNYLVYFIGSTTDVPTTGYNDNVRGQIYLNDYNSEMFCSYISFKIEDASDAAITKDIALERVVGKVEITIEDAQNIPGDINYLYPAIQGLYPNILHIGLDYPADYNERPVDFLEIKYPLQLAGTLSDKIIGFENGNVHRDDVLSGAQYTMTLYLFPNTEDYSYRNGKTYTAGTGTTEDPNREEIMYTDIYIYGTQNKVLDSSQDFPYLFKKKITLNGVDVKKNMKTTLRGNLFGSSIDVNFSATTSWDSGVVDGGTF